jgi:precorrin-8X/cobalt-precorrin-8 methylmutase
MPMADYVRDPAEIYRRSFAAVKEATSLDHLPDGIRAVAARLVHASAMPEIVGHLAFSDDVAQRGRDALAAGAPIIVDCQMLAAGIIRSQLPAQNEIICTLNEDGVREQAQQAGTTRSAAAVDLWAPRLAGAVVAIGNAPTALFRLLELLADGAPRPAAILGFPVGFVGAAESKQALVESPVAVPYITLKGRLGGSAMAAAAVNALATDKE